MSSDTEQAGEGAATKPAPKRKKMLVIGAAAAALLLVGGGGGYMMFGGKAAAEEHGAAAEEEAEPEGGGHSGGEGEAAEAELPLDVPPILVNLRTPDGAPHFLKVHVMLVPGKKSDLETLKKKLPILLDTFQPFLRELRPEDLSGSAAVYRIKEELMLRSVASIGAGQVEDVLVQELVQQ